MQGHRKLFEQWRGDRPYSLETAKEYVEYLQNSKMGANSKRVRWYAAKNIIRKYGGMSEYEFHCTVEWLSRNVKFSGPPRRVIERISDEEFQKVINIASMHSQRVPLFMIAIRNTNMRVGEIVRIRPAPPYPSGISDDLVDRCKKVFDGQQYLFETQGGKRYREAYVSNQIRLNGKRALGKMISAESLRRPVG